MKILRVVLRAKLLLALTLLSLALLCVCSVAQENTATAEGWYKKAQELELSDSREEAVQAYDKAIQLDPQNPKYWNNKAFNLWSCTGIRRPIRPRKRRLNFTTIPSRKILKTSIAGWEKPRSSIIWPSQTWLDPGKLTGKLHCSLITRSS